MSVDAAPVMVLTALTVVGLSLVVRPRRSSSIDFYLAGQRIGVMANALAICGDYFSAASFLGVAAAVYVSGLDGVWYAAGFAAGFVPVLLLIAAPLRRFGQFSLPDFLGRRFDSNAVRLAAVSVVQLITLSYLVPQAVASGITWRFLVGSGILGLDAYATGVVIATAAIAALVAFGGMRGTTWAQAIQFLFLVAVLVWLAALVVGGGFEYTGAVAQLGSEPLRNPAAVGSDVRLVTQQSSLWPDTAARFDQPGARYSLAGHAMLLITLILGTAGLPHVMNRYFTSPTGRQARRTTVWVIGAAGIFYTLAVMLGTAARSIIAALRPAPPWLADLTVDGVLRIPEHALLALGRVVAGMPGVTMIAVAALVAVVSTMAGLLLAAAASWGHDIYAVIVNRRATQAQMVMAGRVAVLGTAAVSAAIALRLEPMSLSELFPSAIATMVTWAFAVAGSALTPILVLAIWWRRMTAAGAVAGLLVGGAIAVGVFLVALLQPGWPSAALLLTPTPIAAPCATAVAVVVSRRTAAPADLPRLWARLHGTAADRHVERLARLTLRGVDTAGPS